MRKINQLVILLVLFLSIYCSSFVFRRWFEFNNDKQNRNIPIYRPSLRISSCHGPCGDSPHVCTDIKGHWLNPERELSCDLNRDTTATTRLVREVNDSPKSFIIGHSILIKTENLKLIGCSFLIIVITFNNFLCMHKREIINQRIHFIRGAKKMMDYQTSPM